jgi:hypothetical protein
VAALAVAPFAFYLTVAYGPQIYLAACQLSVSIGQGLAVYGPAMPAYWDRVYQLAGEAKQRVQNLFRGGETSGNTAQPDPNDPWRWSKDYRQNYEEFYGVKRHPDYQVHHILRQSEPFAEAMRRAGVNVHDPRWLREVPYTGEHRNIHAWITNQWNAWYSTFEGTLTAQHIVDQARLLEALAYQMWGDAIYRTGGLVDWQTLQTILDAAKQ